MENIAEIAHVKRGKPQKKREEEVEDKEEEVASVKQVDVDPNANKEGKEGVTTRAAASVLTERKVEINNTIASTTNKMVSPVMLKLRRNQERRVTPATPVDPVQVPPKQFLGFPADRYMSPTDAIMSPISRGLLARSRRSTRLPPAFVPPKVLDHAFEDEDLTNSSSS